MLPSRDHYHNDVDGTVTHSRACSILAALPAGHGIPPGP